jgi:hypothetical protein
MISSFDHLVPIIMILQQFNFTLHLYVFNTGLLMWFELDRMSIQIVACILIKVMISNGFIDFIYQEHILVYCFTCDFFYDVLLTGPHSNASPSFWYVLILLSRYKKLPHVFY